MITQRLMAFCVACAFLAPFAVAQTTDSATPPPEAVITEETITPETLASAKEAVAALCKEVEMGRYKYAVQRMNPTWKKRTAEQMGGMAKLEEQLNSIPAQMVQSGISIISSTISGTPIPYEVSPVVIKSPGQPSADKWVHSKWLVLIPTTTRVRIIQKNKAPILIDSFSFQAAISDKTKLDWTFIDGSNLSASDLCALFPTLPKNLRLPPVSKKNAQ